MSNNHLWAAKVLILSVMALLVSFIHETKGRPFVTNGAVTPIFFITFLGHFHACLHYMPRKFLESWIFVYNLRTEWLRVIVCEADRLIDFDLTGLVGLDWTGLDWSGLLWIGLDWFTLDWTGRCTNRVAGRQTGKREGEKKIT